MMIPGTGMSQRLKNERNERDQALITTVSIKPEVRAVGVYSR